MEYILRRAHKAGIFGWLYVMTLFHAFHFFSIHFVNSSFLEGLFGNQTDVGLMVAASNALTLLVLISVVVFLKQLGNYQTALLVTSINLIASLGLACVSDTGWLFVFYVLHTTMLPVTLFCLDVFLESYTKDESSTGAVRGVFLSMSITAALFAPVITGWIMGDAAVYRYAYLSSVLYLIPTLFILVFRFRKFEDPEYDVLSVPDMVRALKNNRDIFHVSSAQFFLRFYFSWMVVYLPIYLHQVIGFDWTEIGIILFLMIVPSILIEYPAGLIADKYLGEKELMVTGFLITGGSTIALFFLDSSSIFIWGGMLFLTRVGCALIESMTATYFLNQNDDDDTNILSIFRMLRPLAYTVGPFSAGILLYFVSGDEGLRFLWLLLGIFMFFGTINSLSLKDTR